MKNTIEKVWKKTYKFDFYNFDWTDYLRISRIAWKKEHIVKVYTGDLNWKKDEFLKNTK